MSVILGIDGLEFDCVKEFGCKNLMLGSFGKTDISEFEEPRTIVLWSSFLAGKNLEKEVLAMGNEKMWDFRLEASETFLNRFGNFKAVDVPGFSYDRKQHSLEREMLKRFFAEEIGLEEFEQLVMRHYGKLKEEFLADLGRGFGLLFYYFDVADTMGHLCFGSKGKMREIYSDLDALAGKASSIGEPLLIVSDHGMKSIGRFGDHNPEYGFWANNFGEQLGMPRITELAGLVSGKMM